MILDKNIKINWNGSNRKYYESKNYVFTFNGDEFYVKINELQKGSHCKINVKCDICNKEKIITYQNYLINKNNGGYYSCSEKCSKEKFKQSCIKKYGVENPSQSEEIKNRKIETCLNNYGVVNPSKSINIQNNKIKTNKIKFNCNWPLSNDVIKEKRKINCLKKYGVEHVFQNEKVKEKIKQTCLIKYGVNNISQNDKIKEKVFNTTVEKYGEIWKNNIPKYNPNSIIYLNLISEKLGISIQHALNGGEKKIIKYWIDGYIDPYKLCIEWDENRHKYQKEKDIKRDKYLKNKGFKTIRIKEKDFLNNIEKGVTNIVNKIKFYISSM